MKTATARKSVDLTTKTRRIAQDSRVRIAQHIHSGQDLQVSIVENGKSTDIVTIPESAARHLTRILKHLADGNNVVVTGVDAELSTQRAADLLNVSRPYLIKLLEECRIPYHMVGSHRRVLARDVLAYKDDVDEKRRAALDELTAQAQELNMGY